MSKTYIEEKTFERINFAADILAKGDYENCTFINCVFSNADISGVTFSECEFKACDISMAKTTKTSFKEVNFKDCKLLGLHFEYCNEFLFSVNFENCILNLLPFISWGLKNTRFKNCSLREVDFTECNLTGSVFDNCDLALAKFERTILEKADLRSSYNYSINPEVNKLKKARFSMNGIAGLLDKYGIEIE